MTAQNVCLAVLRPNGKDTVIVHPEDNILVTI
jgi:hypothetical protein